MSVDYSASLAFGHPSPISGYDDPRFPDGPSEPGHAWWLKLAESLGLDADVPYSEQRPWLQEHPCPITTVTIGSSYSGDETTIWAPRGLAFSADIHGAAPKLIEIPDVTGDDRKIVANFIELVTGERPEGEPKWYFGGHIS